MENFAAVISSLASLATVGVAFWGIGQWKRQKIWDHSLEVGRSLLRAIKVYQSEVEASFNPQELIREQIEAANQPGATVSNSQTGYVRLGLRVTKARNDIDLELQEAATLWGDEILEWTDALCELNREYIRYTSFYFVVNDPSLVLEESEKHRDIFVRNFSKMRQAIHIVEWGEGLPPVFTPESHEKTEHMTDVFTEIENLKRRVREKMALPN